MYLSTGDMEEYAEHTSSSLLYLTLEALGKGAIEYSVFFSDCFCIVLHFSQYSGSKGGDNYVEIKCTVAFKQRSACQHHTWKWYAESGKLCLLGMSQA